MKKKYKHKSKKKPKKNPKKTIYAYLKKNELHQYFRDGNFYGKIVIFA